MAAEQTRKENRKRGESIKVVENFLKQEIRHLVERVESKKAQKESSIARLWGKMKEKAHIMEGKKEEKESKEMELEIVVEERARGTKRNRAPSPLKQRKRGKQFQLSLSEMWGKTPPSTANSRMEKTVKRNQNCQKDGETIHLQKTKIQQLEASPTVHNNTIFL